MPRLLRLFLLVLVAGYDLANAAPFSLPDLLADLKSGQTVEVPDGRYEMKKIPTLRDMRGTKEQPVVIRAANRGGATITGVGGFVLKNCEHVVIEGFIFENDADQQCVRLENCRFVRLTRNVFRPKERTEPRHWEHWVTVEGATSGHNRIDRNRFERKVNRGSPLFIRGDDRDLVCSQHDRVERNHFRDVPYANRENGHETLRTGGNDLGAAGRSSFTVFEFNLLERCSGEDEIVSLKSSDNVFRKNTLLDCRGAVCFRLGNRNVAEGNIIIATGDGPSFGGIKLFGFDHRVTGNYFEGLTGRLHEAPFSIFPGKHDTPTTENIGESYDDNTAMAATRCIITGNTWIDCAPLQMGLESEDADWRHLPVDCTFSGNQIVRTKPDKRPILTYGLLRNITAKDNIAYEGAPQPAAPWEAWFRWATEKPEVATPKALTPADVGPDAP